MKIIQKIIGLALVVGKIVIRKGIGLIKL